jgi:metallophosphoesterase superfamily enzyme
MNDLVVAPSAQAETAELPTVSLRALVISDIHATIDADPQTIVAEATAADPDQNALAALPPFLSEHVGSVDLVLCPGDMVHRGQIAPIEWVWRELHRIADDLGAQLIGTAGNHDLLLNPVGPDTAEKGLRDLDPRFPHHEPGCIDTYWAHHFAIVRGEGWRVLAINSSAYLGGYDASENKHGRFDRYCERELPKRLCATDGAAINICVFHHHPQEWTVDSDIQTSHMEQGDKLIGMLEARPEGWMFVHGHKHVPRLDYIGHSSGGPVRLASGSLGANLLEEVGATVRNQFHLIEFDLAAAKELGLRLAGEIETFDWAPGSGWEPAGYEGNLSSHEAFGYRRDGFELANWLQAHSREQRQFAWRWEELISLDPRVRFLSTRDREEFYRAVEAIGGGVQKGIGEVTFP